MGVAVETHAAPTVLQPGTQFGPYQITGLLGLGAMGEVYRAHDLALGRDVALKILPERFHVDPQRLARFAREAQVLGTLNHPNIAMLHGLQPSAGNQALVLELVEGETLAERVAAGPLPVASAIEIARQVAAALAAAHEQGVVHRDLKPANIKLRADGVVKLLDFGLAKVLEPDGADPRLATITLLDAALPGAALGTPAYMSPEQARGLPVDGRSDIWAFGCVLFEMLSGKRAFDGATVSDTVAAVLAHEPDWQALPADCPPLLRRLLRRCLAKETRERLQHIGDAYLELRDALSDDAGTARPPARIRALLLGAGVAVLAAGAAMLVLRTQDKPGMPRGEVTRFEVRPARDQPFTFRSYSRDIGVSGDGRQLAYSSARGSLVVRRLDQLQTTVLQNLGSEVSNPEFSADGRLVAYTTGAALKTVPVAGGTPTLLADVGEQTDRSFVWAADGSVIVASTDGLQRVPAGGGKPEWLAVPDAARDEKAFGTPEMLPGGQWLLYMIQPLRIGIGPRIVALNLVTRERRELLRGGSSPRYLPTGHLVYAVENSLQAVRFDAARLEVLSSPETVVDDVMVNGNGIASYAIGANGTLVYAPADLADAERHLAWVTRDGRAERLDTPALNYVYPRLSPDGGRLALDIRVPDRDIWTWDLMARQLTRVTTDPSENALPAWSPNGRELAFGDGRSGAVNVYRQRLVGGQLERLTESTRRQLPAAYLPDGSALLFNEARPTGDWDVMLLKFGLPNRIEPLLTSPASEMNVMPSPDGRWITYSSDESGRVEIYVRPFPDVNRAQYRVSPDGGSKPLWSHDGREIFFISAERELVAAEVALQPTFRLAGVRRLFDATAFTDTEHGSGARPYDASADGQRFLMIQREGKAGEPRIIVVMNWFDEVERAFD
jgi:serine/threonine-protein kinase